MIRPEEFNHNSPYRDLIIPFTTPPFKTPEQTFPARYKGTGNTPPYGTNQTTVILRK